MTENEVNELMSQFVNTNYSFLTERIDNIEYLKNVTTKWSPIMRNFVENLSTNKIIWTLEVDSVFSLVFEILYLSTSVVSTSHISQKQPTFEQLISVVFGSIVSKLEKKVDRHRIVGRWFNKDLNIVEWELENGDFIPSNTLPSGRKLSLSADILPDWYLYLVDKFQHRSRLLTRIFENEN